MKKLLFLLFLLIFIGHAYAVTNNVTIEGRLDVGTGINTTGFTTASALTATTSLAAGNIYSTNIFGVEDVRGAVFIYPFATAEANIRLPYNASITSIEVFCVGGTSVNGSVSNNGAAVGNATANNGAWAVATIAPNSYTAFNTIRLFTPTVTGAVQSATVLIRVKRTP